MASIGLQELGTSMVILAVVVAVGVYVVTQVNTSFYNSLNIVTTGQISTLLTNFTTALGQFGTWASILVSPKRETTLGRVKSWA